VALFRGKAVSDQILGEFVQRETATVDPEQFTDIYFEILISEAGRYIWQWYMDPVFVDTSDTVTKSGSTLCYDAVDTYGITSIEALRQQSHLYFTYSAISELEGDYIEQDGKLYLPRANGLGGDGYTTVYIESKKISDTQYQLTLYGTWSFQEGTEVTTINYVLEDDQWVLDGYPAGAILASTNSIDQMP
jgi:hypothetical protein